MRGSAKDALGARDCCYLNSPRIKWGQIKDPQDREHEQNCYWAGRQQMKRHAQDPQKAARNPGQLPVMMSLDVDFILELYCLCTLSSLWPSSVPSLEDCVQHVPSLLTRRLWGLLQRQNSLTVLKKAIRKDTENQQSFSECCRCGVVTLAHA